MFRVELLELLHQGLTEMGLTLNRQSESQLIRYIELISQWNKSSKLSSIRDTDAMITRHLLDSLSILPYITGRTVLDAGTGAGLPGLPLSLGLPEKHFCLLDNNHRKTQFLQTVCRQLGLRNVQVVNRRVENFYVKPLFETIVSRSFGTLNDSLNLTQHLLKPGGKVLAMKGVYPLTELQDFDPAFKVMNVHPLKVPGLSAERHVIELSYQPEMAFA